MTKSEKAQYMISYIVSFMMLIGAVWSFFAEQYMNAFLGMLAFLFTYLPSLIGRNLRIILPIEIELLVVLFVYASLYLGMVNEYFEYFWWWDIFMHGLMGLFAGLVGFMIIYSINLAEKISPNLRPFFIALFSFSFALSIGALWEIYEFVIDKLLGYEWQENSLDDTMVDIILDTGGALFTAVIGYYYVKKVKIPIFNSIMNKFIEKNPRLFKNW